MKQGALKEVNAKDPFLIPHFKYPNFQLTIYPTFSDVSLIKKTLLCQSCLKYPS